MKLQHPERLKNLQKFLKSPIAFTEIPEVGISGEKRQKRDLRKEYSDERYAILFGREEERLGTYDVIIFCNTRYEIDAIFKFGTASCLQVFDLEKNKVIFIFGKDKRPVLEDLINE